MSSIRFITISVQSEGTGQDSSGLSMPFGGVDPYNQLPHPVEMVKKVCRAAQRLMRSMRQRRPRTVPATQTGSAVFTDA
jgi:hypothetical protein